MCAGFINRIFWIFENIIHHKCYSAYLAEVMDLRTGKPSSDSSVSLTDLNIPIQILLKHACSPAQASRSSQTWEEADMHTSSDL